jgi:dTDP-4-amino-4,6-dideoxygalactose transaminase
MKTLPGSAAKNSPSVHPRIPVAAPVLDGRETEYVLECLSTSWISSKGRFISEFERAFAGFCGVKHAVATCNGTAALHLGLVALGLKPGDEVIVPSLTYIASANVVQYCGARPVFVDNDVHTFNMDVDAVAAEITPRTKGIMPVHLYGHPVDLDPLLWLAQKHDLFLLEDAAEAVGARYKGRRLGAHGDCCAFSFFGNKIITTGEGGMVTTDHPEWAARLRRLREHGMNMSAADRHASAQPVLESYLETGFNYRMTDIQAAVGLVQLGRLDTLVARRRQLAARYHDLLADLPGVRPVRDPAHGTTNFQSFWVLLERGDRDSVLGALAEAGISARRGIMAAHLEPAYADVPHAPLPATERLTRDSLILPLYHEMTDEEQEYVVRTLAAALP